MTILIAHYARSSHQLPIIIFKHQFNFKKETLNVHAKSIKHKNCLEHQKVLSKPGSLSLVKSAQKLIK